MTKSQAIEYKVVSRAVKTSETEGVGMVLSDFVLELQKLWPPLGIEHADVLDALKRLHPQIINLRKWDPQHMEHRSYKGESEDGPFFYRGDAFRVKRTPQSRPYLEQLESLFVDGPATEGPKRPIGFIAP
jgi:hypothetical protein